MIAAALALAVVAVWINSLGGAFVLDDLAHIVHSPWLDRLWPPDWARTGREDVLRPVLMLTFALNVAAGGRSPAGFHVVNVAIHLAATLLLFDLVRRTLRLAAVRERCRLDPDRAARAVALLWAVHPAHTESVTYIYQRAESLVGMCHLLVLWLAVRAFEQPGRRRWPILATLACAIGMGVKESMAVVPVAVALYDRGFLFGSWREALRRRRMLWAGLGAAWIPLAWLVPPHEMYTAARSGPGDPVAYALTSPGVILHYLDLAVRPAGIVLEEDWRLAAGVREALPAIAGLGAVIAAAAVAARRLPGLGPVALWAVLVLLPTTSVIPLRDPAAVRRMYLPLAALSVFVVVLGAGLLRRAVARWSLPPGWAGRLAVGWVLVIAALLGWQTVQRNRVYRSPVALYADVVAKRPRSIRGHQNLAWALAVDGRFDDAIAHTRRTLDLDPAYGEGWFNLGVYLRQTGRTTEAIAAYRKALALNPEDYRAATNLNALLREREARTRFPQ